MIQEKHIIRLAEEHRTAARSPFNRRIKLTGGELTSIIRCYAAVSRSTRDDDSMAQWLLDNYQSIMAIAQDNSCRLRVRGLPVIRRGAMHGFHRVYALALDYTDSCNGNVTSAGIIEYLQIYQQNTVLDMEELWALCSVIETVLIRNIAAACTRRISFESSLYRLNMRAEDFCKNINSRLSDCVNTDDTVRLAQFIRRVMEQPDCGDALDRLGEQLQGLGLEQDAVLDYSDRIQWGNAVTFRNTVSSLINIGTLDWEGIFSAVSLQDRALCSCEHGVYCRMDDESKNIYRKQIVRLAQKRHINEQELVLKTVGMANTRACDVSELIFEDKPKYLVRMLYTLAIVSISVAMYAGTLWLTVPHVNTAVAVLCAILFAVPCYCVGTEVANTVASGQIQPRKFCRLDFEEGLPENCLTAILVPALLTDEKQIQEIVNRMEANYLANRSKNLYSVLLGDWCEGNCESNIEDERIKNFAKNAIAELNKKYGENIFFYLHRPRRYSKTQKSYFGWERKRGAMLEFNRFVVNGDKRGFCYMSEGAGMLVGTKYVVTLDTDTVTPIGSIAKLVGTMHHPMNMPEVDRKTNTVTKGCGILQPCMKTSAPSATKTLFARMMSGSPGMGAYSFGEFEAWQDIWGVGNFSGKGIYMPEVFCRVLDGRFPQNTVLSHDMIEGVYLRAGYVSDISFIDEIPSNYISWRKRAHRWMRGDWQLLPFVRQRVTNEAGERLDNPAGMLPVMKMLDNMIRTLYEPSLAVLAILGGAEYRLLAVGVAFALIRSAVSVVAELWAKLVLRLRGFDLTGRKTGVFARAILSMMLVVDTAQNNIDAVARTLYRLRNGSNLLQWQTAQQAEQGRRDIFAYYRIMQYSTAVGVWMISMGAVSGHILTAVIGALFAVAPGVMYITGAELKARECELKGEQREVVEFAARGAWEYYRDFCKEEYGYLPPDNYQAQPYKGAALRTSPTNIGMMLAGCVAAEKLGYVRRGEAVRLVANALLTLDKLKKNSGQPYNWYDITTLEPLEPMFVSSADNGNLACALICLRQALEVYYRESRSEELRMLELKCIGLCNKLLEAMDFGCFYDREKKLLAVGIGDGRTPYAYDLLASEARQASFIGVISKNIPVAHWSRLARQGVIGRQGFVLKSWSGSMFEYLMPALFMKTYSGTLWETVYRNAVKSQRLFGKAKGIPWGISESGYLKFDENQNYQYKAFGVPELAARRITDDRIVIAPYACALGLHVCLKNAADNLIRMRKCGLVGEYGFYEAGEVSGGKILPIASYMAHHQGMILLSAANTLCDGYITDLFHSSPTVRAGEYLLWEELVTAARPLSRKMAESPRVFAAQRTGIEQILCAVRHKPRLCVLHDGDYSAVLSSTGSGYSAVNDILLNKWRRDELWEKYGHFIFIKDMVSNKTVCAAPAPLYKNCGTFRISFKPWMAEYINTANGLHTRLCVAVTGTHKATVFRLDIRNTGRCTRKLLVADYVEAALERVEETAAHPQYSDMFCKFSTHSRLNAVLVTRNPRGSADRKHCMAIVCAGVRDCKFITSKLEFVGRNRDITNPRFCDEDFVYGKEQSSSVTGCASVGSFLEIAPGSEVRLAYTVVYADNEEELRNRVEYFSKPENTEIFEDAHEMSVVNVKAMSLTNREYILFNRLVSGVMYPKVYNDDFLPPCEASFLWKYGISGDIPIICYRTTGGTKALGLVLKMFELLARANIRCDLVLISSDDGYHGDNYHSVLNAVETSLSRGRLNSKGGIFIVRSEHSAYECSIIQRFAAINIEGSIAKIYAELVVNDKPVKQTDVLRLKSSQRESIAEDAACEGLTFANGYGGFDMERREYKILLPRTVHTPQPWSNIMANKSFGTLVTECGGGYTWYKNSRENKLTSWSNDPISDTPSEVLYIRDRDNSSVYTAEKLGRHSLGHTVSYGQGYAVYEGKWVELDITRTVFVPETLSAKVSLLDIKNNTDKTKRLSIAYYADCRLSSGVTGNDEGICTRMDAVNGIFIAQNNCIPQNGLMFLTSDEVIEDVCSSKLEFFGRLGNIQSPRGVFARNFNRRATADCMVIRLNIELKPYCSKTTVLILGGADNVEQAAEIKKALCDVQVAQAALREVKACRGVTYCPIEIVTRDESLNALFNNFLLYQVYVCRYLARTSFYQCSGAYGFRDQLQDALAFMYCNRQEARAHILRAAAQQFEAGDVRHWWHETTGYGIRTKISDDMMFLPYVAAEYARFTDDYKIFDEQIPFASGQEIEKGEHSHFGRLTPTDYTKSLYDHCLLALKCAKFGERGLLLMGTGDWNDGMDKVGEDGKGESVWLTFFVYYVVQKFKSICLRYNDIDNIAYIDSLCGKLKDGIDKSAWDGDRFRRAYYDDGTPLGSAKSDECKMDVIAQAWAAISNIPSKDKVAKALESADKLLVDENNGIVKLFTPPFENSSHNPGYIKAYKPGLRENGGQYTHGAVWLVWAYMEADMPDEAYRILRLLNPVNHALTKADADKYKVEPYVVAADVYSAKSAEGMGGWTWYTGSAAWMYKVILENVLGLVISGNTMEFSGNVPKALLPLRVNYTHEDGTRYTVDMVSGGEHRSIHDGELFDGMRIGMKLDSKVHKVILSIAD